MHVMLSTDKKTLDDAIDNTYQIIDDLTFRFRLTDERVSLQTVVDTFYQTLETNRDQLDEFMIETLLEEAVRQQGFDPEFAASCCMNTFRAAALAYLPRITA